MPAKQKTGEESYVDLLLQEWGISKRSRRLHDCLRRVLRELHPQALMVLRREPKVEVICGSAADYAVWAYFPMHPALQIAKQRRPKSGSMAELVSALRAGVSDIYKRRLIASQYRPKPATRVLLVLSEKHFEKQPLGRSKDELRDHLGHTLLFLRSPRAPNECSDAQRKWHKNTRE